MFLPPKKPKPIWEYPKDYDFPAAEGAEAFARGYELEDNPYADTVSGKSWCQGWKTAHKRWLEENNDKPTP